MRENDASSRCGKMVPAAKAGNEASIKRNHFAIDCSRVASCQYRKWEQRQASFSKTRQSLGSVAHKDLIYVTFIVDQRTLLLGR